MINNREAFDAIVHRQFDQERNDRIEFASSDPQLVEAVIITRAATEKLTELDFDINKILESVSARYSIDREDSKTAWVMCDSRLDGQLDEELAQLLSQSSVDPNTVETNEAG